jgi:hypothetical protein
MVIIAVGWGTCVHAESDATTISPTASDTATPPGSAAQNGAPVVHKTHHKKKPTTASSLTANGTSTVSTHTPAVHVKSPSAQPEGAAQVNGSSTQAHADPATTPHSAPTSPAVETGLPIGRYPGMGSPITGVSTFVPQPVRVPATTSRPPTPVYYAMLPTTGGGGNSEMTGNHLTSGKTAVPSDDFVFTDFSHKAQNTYPWRTGIITTEFWIGEGSTPVSSTTNEDSAWDHWRSSNSGSDSPYDRDPSDARGLAPASHAATVNPFYVALPFNDLAFPEKAREWLPRGWYRRPRDGKQVSACKDRWVEIKNAQGRICYAQWEDVGPLGYEDADYVFGGASPVGLNNDRAGLDVSPDVAEYLHINDRNSVTSWRFVDDDKVSPGAWLKLDEQAVLYQALHQLKNFHSLISIPPIQRGTEPSEDPSDVDADKKKVDQSKG